MKAPVIAVLLLCLGMRAASAQTTPVPTAPPVATPEQDETQRLYREALQSIAEGRKTDASHTLEEVVQQEPMHAGAWLDLALIQCAMGRSVEAERLFAEVETKFDPPEAILSLIAEARKRGCNAWEPRQLLTISAGRGNELNVNQGASAQLDLLPEFQPRHDQFSSATIEYARDVTPNGTMGFAQLQAKRFDSEHDYDASSLFVGVEQPWRFGRWPVRASAMVGATTLGGKMYQTLWQVQGRLGLPLPLPPSMQATAMLGYTQGRYRTLTNFDSGTTELRGQLTYRGDGQYGSVNASYLDDRARGTRPGGDRKGMLVSGTWRKLLPYALTGEATLTHERWNGSVPYAPGVIDEVRHQRTDMLRGSLSYAVGRASAIVLEARVLRNHENVAIFRYNDRQVQLSWQWQYP